MKTYYIGVNKYAMNVPYGSLILFREDNYEKKRPNEKKRAVALTSEYLRKVMVIPSNEDSDNDIYYLRPYKGHINPAYINEQEEAGNRSDEYNALKSAEKKKTKKNKSKFNKQ